ncbi:hypothetical protein [Meiothermus taiwanensis]|jgi:dolichol kinase|uniref:Uncharacterized protein n=2 Tax=Meiothermus taiwanensis TaxID=172827 RepID=A0A399DYQ4_9DEIN|nr:hypothetical protein [Meiothermus taiwanensis]AWR87941.1 hypothetical protein Mtai_v1c27130 [Meiothermus taiwanensis WR-220]KIQ54346.1 hypothetical protein SY28_09120 [Meiothermus taiwanensis]KZK14708.1 hypothetical protein A3962_12855 [Meiothermus taiwanensis]RIH75062.1 hypothetical protein Mcate_02418 [Meiothermus taiwanensis]
MKRLRESLLYSSGIAVARELISPSSDLGVLIFRFAIVFALIYLLHPFVTNLEEKFLQKFARGDQRKIAAYEASYVAFGAALIAYLLFPWISWLILLAVGAASYLLWYRVELWLNSKDR